MKKNINQILGNENNIKIYFLPWLIVLSFLLRLIAVYFYRDTDLYSSNVNEWNILLENLIKYKSLTFYSFNGELIMMSKYFKFNVITILILATLSIILNYLLIPNFGMIGAAYASLISILIFNLIKLIFIKIKMKILPFSNKTIIVIFMGLLTYFLSIYIPNLENSLINILLKSTLISIFYIILIYKFKISPELNKILNRIISPQKS